MLSLITTWSLWIGAAEPSPAWRMELLDGKPVEFHLRSIEADGEFRGMETEKAAGNSVISLERIATPRPPWPGEPHLLFASGDRLVGLPRGSDQRLLMFQTPIAGANGMKVPLSRLDTIWFRAPGPSQPRSEKIKRDRVTLKNGDRLLGTVSGVRNDDLQLQMDIDGKTKLIPGDQLASLSLNPELRSDRIPDQPYWQLTLRDGSRLSLLSLRLSEQRITGTTLFRAEVAFPLSELIAIDRVQGKVVWLSTLKPSRFEPTPYLTQPPSWSADTNLLGGQLAVGAIHYDRGIAMESRSTLTYELAGADRFFLVEVGLDPESGRRGHADAQILLDGQPVDLPELKGLTAQREPVRLRIPLEGVKKLTLSVDWGEGGPVGDHVNWGNARLLRR